MPIYQYRCRKCGHSFDLIRGISEDDADVKCPRCGAENPERSVSTFSSFSSGGSCAPTGGG
jgi:putative FmdB family regulatory protein